MATLEQSLKLHDQFSKVLNNVSNAVDKTLGSFERLNQVVSKDISISGTDNLTQSLNRSNDSISTVNSNAENLSNTVENMGSNASQNSLINADPTIKEVSRAEQALTDFSPSEVNKMSESLFESQNTIQELTDTKSSMEQLTDTFEMEKYRESLFESQRTIEEFDTTRNAIDQIKSTVDALYNQTNNQSLIDSDATNNEANKIDQQLLQLTQNVNKLTELSLNQPLIQSEPTTNELDQIKSSSAEMEGFFKRLEGTIRDLTTASITQSLFDSEPTTNNLQQTQVEVEQTKQSLQGVYDSLDSQTKQAFGQLDLVTEAFRIQEREVDSLTAKLQEEREYNVNTEGLINLEKKLNSAQLSLERKRGVMDKAKATAYELDQQMYQVGESMNAISENQSFENMGSKIEQNVVRIQTLIDRTKEIAMIPIDASMDAFSNVVDLAGNKVDSLKNKLIGANTPIGRLRERFSDVTQSIKESELAQSRFGQVIQKTAGFGRDLFSGLKRAGSDFLRITKDVGVATAKLPFSWMKIPSLIGQATSAMFGKRREVSETGDEINRATNNTNRLGGAVKLVKFTFWLTAIRKVTSALANLSGYVDGITQSQARLDIMLDITASDQSLKQVSDQVMASALDTRTAWQETADFVNQIGLSAGQMFSKTSEIVGFTNLMQKSFKIAGASASEMQSGMNQVVQSMSRGTIQAEQLNSLMRNSPVAIQALNDYLDVSSDKLYALAKDGQISGETLRNAMFAYADDINTMFEQIPITWAERWQEVKNVALYAFEPLRDAWNEFVNSNEMSIFFDALTRGFVFVAQMATWAFEVISAGFNWLMQHIETLKMALTIVGIVFATVAIFAMAKWIAIGNVFMLLGAIIWWLADVLQSWGITAGDVIAHIAYAVVWLGTVFWNMLTFVNGLFIAFFQTVFNLFAGFYNNVVSVAEFFMNVFKNPVYAAQMLFYNMVSQVLNFFGSMADGAGNAGDAIANAFVNGVNRAINMLNGLIDIVNKVPFLDFGHIGNVGQVSDTGNGRRGSGQASAGDKIRNLAENFRPDVSNRPDDYTSLSDYRLDMTPISGITNVLGNMQSPSQNALKAFNATNNAISSVGDFMQDFDASIDQGGMALQDAIDQASKGANAISPADRLAGGNERSGKNAADKLGKGKEVGDVGKIKDDVNISDEDLKYLKDIAEANFVVRMQQLSPSATVNLNSTGNTEEDMKKLLEKLEEMIEQEIATSLL